MPTFPTPGPITATVQVAGARVRVRSSDRADTVVLIEPVDATRRLDVKVAERIKVAFAGGNLSVRTTTSGDKSGSAVVTIDLPTGSHLIAYLAHADISADGALGGCDVHMAKGQIRLDRVDTLMAQVSAGDVVIAHLAGTADVSGRLGELRIGEAGGAVTLKGSTARVSIGSARSGVELSNAGGSVDIGRADGGVVVSSTDCPIRIGRMTRGAARLLNASGGIELGIGAGAVARVDARSTKGTVRNLLPADEHPDPLRPAVTVHARTRHGDIVIRRAAG